MPENLPLPTFLDLKPSQNVIEALRGSISEPVSTISQKPGFENQTVNVRLVKDGAGLFGLTDWRDNKEWSGITNHVLLSTRYSVDFAKKMLLKGFNTNPQRVLDGGILSHTGRRQSDEAKWYSDGVNKIIGIEEANKRRNVSNEMLGMRIIEGKVPPDAFELVAALGHNVEGFSGDPSIYQSLDFLISIYVDHRTAQKYEPLNTRMGDFLLGYFFSKEERTPGKKTEVYNALGNLITKQKNYRLGKEKIRIINDERVLLDEADKIAESLGAKPKSERLTRRELMRLILQDADTEATLLKAGIDPDAVNEETVPMPRWEDEFRTQYVEAAKDGILQRLKKLKGTEQLDKEFPPSTWWSQYVRRLASMS